MRAVVLAGGLGTRLQPYTTVLPKPLIPIGQRPILELLLERLVAGGVTRLDICLGYLGELIQAYFTQAVTLPDHVELRWHRESEPLGTAGALRVIDDLEGAFICVNGDVLPEVDYADLIAHHTRLGADLTIAMHRQDVALDLGVLQVGDDQIVSGYDEKPTLGFDVSAGVYVYSASTVERMPGGVVQFPDLVVGLLRSGAKVAAYRLTSEVVHIGTPAQLAAAHEELERRGPSQA